MKNRLLRGLIGLLLTTSLLTTFTQAKLQDKTIIDRISCLNFLTIKISHYSERYERQEIDVIYHQDSFVKIHSILRSNFSKDNTVDTIFALNGQQLEKLEKFEINFNNNKIPTGVVIAGTLTIYMLNLNGETRTLENKSDYSLILDLLTE